MLYDVQQQEIIEIQWNLGKPFIQIMLHVGIEAFASVRKMRVDANDITVLQFFEGGCYFSTGTSQIKYSGLREYLRNRNGMRAFEVQFKFIFVVTVQLIRAIKLRLVKYPKVLRPRLENSSGHVPRILKTIYVRYFSPIVGWNRQLDDSETCPDQLYYDFCIEVEVVGIELEGNAFESGRR